jgi:GxxExxY protein
MTGGTTRARLELLHGSVTKEIIGAFYSVYNAVGYGLPESAYQRGLLTELGLRGVESSREVPFSVQYKGIVIGEYRTDLIVARQVIVECKVAEKILPAHEVQLLTYLRATGLSVGLILNFGPTATFRRMALTSSEPGSSIIRA